MESFITSYCAIKNQQVFLDGNLIFSSEETELNAFLKDAYKFLELSYPKFHKMDRLSKLAILASELILKDSQIEDTAILFANSTASLDTDVTYQSSIANTENYYPSPAVFVYTLPNICVGELCIKHKIHGENAFFVMEKFNPEQLIAQANYLLKFQKSEQVLIAWIDVLADNYECFMYLVSRKGIRPFIKEELLTLNTL